MIGEENNFKKWAAKNADEIAKTRVRKEIDTKKSLSEILDSFRCISEEYNRFNNSTELDKHYSNYLFSECTQDEQKDFCETQLNKINCLVTNSIYEKQGLTWNWKTIYDLLFSETYKNVDKINRKVVYSTQTNLRPIGDTAYTVWNGMQIIDIDIKNKDIAEGLKYDIFDELKQYHWFLGICKSASGKSLHVWTKITPIADEQHNKKIEYLCNFRHKYSYIYIILSKYIPKYGYTKDNIFEYMDMAMAKPQQGIFISSDSDALMNSFFKDTRIDVNFESAFNSGIESIDWISHPELKTIFAKLEWFTNDKFDKKTNVEISELVNVKDRNIKKEKGAKHYKHAQRWQLANTLTAIYGEEQAIDIMIQICKDTPIKELKGDVRTAKIHNKPITIWAVTELNKQHGFNIEIKGSDTYKEELNRLDAEIKKETNKATDPTKILNDKTNQIRLHITSKQYLSDIKDEIISNLSHISLLEAGAGYGKTEMVKAFGGKTMLILPFTSTIKAKVESSETTKDWLYYYGNKRPTLDELLGSQSMSMTIDKFSHLNLMELDQAAFDYIVIDESHLLFTSSYRDVMSPCIQRLANCKAKVILMTGTPTGEMVFFPNIKHIKVVKDDLRIKQFELHMCPSGIEQTIEMAKSMAKDVVEGRKALFPTNKGNLYFEQITGLVQQYLDAEKYTKPLKAFYYKKSNYGDDSMDHINIDKSIGDNDIIFCTTYLSVGVDICDRYKFSVYFNETWIPQDIEQFANRLRNNDLYLKMYLPKKDSMGIPINYYNTDPLDLSFEQKDLLLARDLIRTCNDMLERNMEESRYNPLIQSLISSNRYLKYDENDCKYYIDETTYKLKVFEERYAEFSKQLEVLLNGIKYYGYTFEKVEHNDEVIEDHKEKFNEYLKTCRNIKFNYNTTQTRRFLDHITDENIDLYRELLKGNYEIFKDEKYKEVRGDNQLYAEDIEILERNTPIVLGLYKYYDCETIKEIYEYCIEPKQNRINFAKLGRIRSFVNIDYNWRKKRLDYPIIRFIKDAHLWVHDNYETTKEDINIFLDNYACKISNHIKDVCVNDNELLITIRELIGNLWNIIIIQSRPKNGIIKVTPFDLIWENKLDITNIYGTKATKDFFIETLIDEMKEDEKEDIIDNADVPELEMTSKIKLEDIEKDLPKVIHKEYDYNVYSDDEHSGLNSQFIRKQENTKQSISINTTTETIDTIEENKEKLFELPLFDDEEAPF